MAISKLYSRFPLNGMGGDVAGDGPMDLLSDVLKAMLTTSTHTLNQTGNEVKANITNEVTGTGYTAGGETLASKTYSTSSLVTTFDAADVVWSTASFTARHLHLYNDTPTAPADPLISYVDFEGDQTVTGANFTVQWNSSGIFTITVA